MAICVVILLLLIGLRTSCAYSLSVRGKVRQRSLSLADTKTTPSSIDSSAIVTEVSRTLAERFFAIDLKTKRSLEKIIQYFEEEKVDTSYFHGVTGYGYGDIGREKFDNIIAKLMGAEAALVRLQLFSGTHAISTALFACLRPGQSMLCVSGHPYDTLEEVIGLREGSQTGSLTGSLKDWGIGYSEIELLYDAAAADVSKDTTAVVAFNLAEIDKRLEEDSNIKLIHVQRSCGYQWRPSIPIKEIRRLCEHVNTTYKQKGREVVIFVDNCYGELVEDEEPCHAGADLIAGSLIKNLGGTLAPCGGYVAGKAELVAAATVHLAAPGVEGGATFGQYRHLYQGLFNAPGVVGESLKGAELVAEVMQNVLGFQCNPPPGSHRTDIIQAVRLESRQRLISFCEGVQKKSPVGAYIRPIPGMSSGYGSEVIFADGTFIDGSTLELSADGPLREPYVVFSQGCTHWTHWAIVLEEILRRPAFQEKQS